MQEYCSYRGTDRVVQQCTIHVYRHIRVLHKCLFFVCYSRQWLSKNHRLHFIYITFVVRATLQRHFTENSKQILPEMKLRGLSPNSYIRVSLSDLYIFPRSVCLFCCRKIGGRDRGNMYKSLTDTWMRKLAMRPRSSFSGIYKSELLCSVRVWCMLLRIGESAWGEYGSTDYGGRREEP